MEPQYHQFGLPDNTTVPGEHRMTAATGMKRAVGYVLYGVLVLLLLILIMITGVKFSQLNNEITDVKYQLEKISNAGGTSGAHHVQTVLVKKVVPVRGTCKAGWVSFQRSCYLLSNSILTWSQAEEHCRAQGGHLVVLNTVEELDYISGIVEILYDYWIGLVEREREGHWTWVDGTDFNTTPNLWDDGQPDNWAFRENGEDCGQLHSSDVLKRKLMNDADCGLKYHYICEIKV